MKAYYYVVLLSCGAYGWSDDIPQQDEAPAAEITKRLMGEVNSSLYTLYLALISGGAPGSAALLAVTAALGGRIIISGFRTVKRIYIELCADGYLWLALL